MAKQSPYMSKNPSLSKKDNTGNAARSKGHNAERNMARIFRDAGFTHACTTRASSHLLDSCGIDLNYIPVIVQIKAGTQRGLSIPGELEYIKTQMSKLLPSEEPWHQKPRAIIHVKPASTKGRSDYDCLVTMTFKDWMRIIQLAYPQNNTITPNEQSLSGAAADEAATDEGLS